jgi:hypothetical protein
MIEFILHTSNKYNTWGAEITSGPFEGVAFEIADLSFSDEDEGLVTFDYYVIKVPENIKESKDELTKSKEFEKTLQDILQIIIRDAIEFSASQNDSNVVIMTDSVTEDTLNDRTDNTIQSSSQ